MNYDKRDLRGYGPGGMPIYSHGRPLRGKERSEDDIVQEKLGPRGVPGEPSPTKLTPRAAKQLPCLGKFDGHTA